MFGCKLNFVFTRLPLHPNVHDDDIFEPRQRITFDGFFSEQKSEDRGSALIINPDREEI